MGNPEPKVAADSDRQIVVALAQAHGTERGAFAYRTPTRPLLNASLLWVMDNSRFDEGLRAGRLQQVVIVRCHGVKSSNVQQQVWQKGKVEPRRTFEKMGNVTWNVPVQKLLISKSLPGS